MKYLKILVYELVKIFNLFDNYYFQRWTFYHMHLNACLKYFSGKIKVYILKIGYNARLKTIATNDHNCVKLTMNILLHWLFKRKKFRSPSLITEWFFLCEKLQSPSHKYALCHLVRLKLALVFWRSLNVVNYFLLFNYYLHYEKDMVIHLNNLESPLIKVDLYQVFWKWQSAVINVLFVIALISPLGKECDLSFEVWLKLAQ